MFRFRLAALFGVPVAALEETLEAAEYDRWAEFWSVEGFGEGRADLRAGIVAAVIANVNRGKNTKPFTPEDFMPSAKPKTESAAEQIKSLDMFFGMHNAMQKAGG